MAIRQVLLSVFVAAALSVALGAGFGVSDAWAEQGTEAAQNPGTIREALEQQLGKRAKLKLASGQDLEGKVMEVGDEVVVINELAGMEFFGATVRLDQVAAVIVRTRTQ